MRKIKVISMIFICNVWLVLHVNGQEKENYVKTDSGIEVSVLHSTSGIKKIRLQPVTDQIIHITAVGNDDFPKAASLMSIKSADITVQFSVDGIKDLIVLKTKKLNVEISAETGTLTYRDNDDKLLLAQSKLTDIALVPRLFNGESSYQVSQLFDIQDNEAYYGLGQHQQGIVNYRGRRVDLSQYNTEIGVPFVVSNKGYGLLWDNYSITRAGDVRDYQPLNALRLFSKDNNEGWLTASYAEKTSPEKILFVQPVSEISLNWLTDQHKFPDRIKMKDAIVTYEGAVESDLDGTYQLQLKYAGYIKVWLDGKLVADYWRQAWNSGSAILDLALQKNKKIGVKMEWIPDGGESYLGLTCLPPAPEALKNIFGLRSESGSAVDYYFISGENADQVISGYRTVTGKAVLLPKWAMGFWQSRERYKTQDDILSTVKAFRDRKIPLDNIVLDWSYWKEPEWGSQQFDPARFPTPVEMIRSLHEQHVNLMISVWPKFNKGFDIYDDFDKNRFLYKRNIAERRLDWIGRGYSNTFYDAFNPKARISFWDLVNTRLYQKGIDAWWMDATEPDMHSNLPVEARKELMTPTFEGSPTTYFNAFPLVNAKGIYEGQRKTNPLNRVFILTRSAYAGLQRYASVAWSGDIASRWEDMKSQIGAGINFSLSGMPNWTMDIGGFSVEKRYEQAKGADLEEWRELNTRWYQFGAFVPLFRVHGQFPYREIYNIAPEDHPAYKSMLYYNKLRYRLMPYIYSLAGSTYHQDYTIMRGLMMDFPKDLKAINLNDSYLFGPSLLINPVYKYKERKRTVYLPEGQGWYDLYTGQYFKGGQDIHALASYQRMPVYVKEGTILPTGPELQYTTEKVPDAITLFIYTGKDASFSLYEDEGINYNYEQGAFSNIDFNYTENNKTLSLSDRRGNFKGMMSHRDFRIIVIGPKSAKPLDFNQKADYKLSYTGRRITIKL
ncbi:alpha-xylosidase [Pedobacter sp. HMWF019]|uniref:glycoside hydrolase family 31 protein n=1 Tax=Pedobacter sp. HMWF019 TaxID=2056856 RepID=UPI000D3C67C0|nr:TIM-barrel domain-containing protein [Pedobacter sp. HMWF019]PTT00223.1 alpha-xylosidase [Pedobacter sp. HMWF019]